MLHYRGKLYIITDKAGAVPVFCYAKGNSVEISNTWLPLAKNNNVSLNYQSAAHYISSTTFNCKAFHAKTLANEISLLDHATIYTLGKNLTVERYCAFGKDLTIDKYKSLEDVVDRAEKIISDNFAFLKDTSGIHCNVTGGFDTRTNLAVLMHEGIPFNAGNELPVRHDSILTKGRYSDLVISKKIAERFNLDLDTYTGEEFRASVARKRKYNDLIYLLFEANCTAERLDYIFKIAKKHKIVITGMLGSEVVNQHFHFLQNYRGLGADTFVREAYPYVDVINDERFSEKEYYGSMTSALEDMLSGIRYQNPEDLSAFINYFAFYRTDFSKMLGAYNCGIPAYSPFLEADFLKFIIGVPFKMKNWHSIQRILISRLNRELASIDTTHGYPASTVTYRNFYRFLRLLNPIEPNLQYVGVLRRLSGFFKRKLWANHGVYRFVKSVYKGYLNRLKGIEKKFADDDLAIYKSGRFITSAPVFKVIDKNKMEKAVKKYGTGGIIKGKTAFDIVLRADKLNHLLEEVSFKL